MAIQQDDAVIIEDEPRAQSPNHVNCATPFSNRPDLAAVEDDNSHIDPPYNPAKDNPMASSQASRPAKDKVPTLIQEISADDDVHTTQRSRHQNRAQYWGEKPKPPLPLLRYRKRAIYLLLFYLPFLIVPWTLVCILAVKPLGKGSYISQSGMLSPSSLRGVHSWLVFIRVMNAVAGVIAIPITSALLAQAAVVYSERRKVTQKLSIKQLFVLADRDWMDLSTLWEIFRANKEGSSTPFLWLAAALISIGAIQPLVQQALVNYEPFTAMSCLDLPYNGCYPGSSWVTQGYDPEPGDLVEMPQNVVIQDMRAQLATFTESAIMPLLWLEHSVEGLDVSRDLGFQAELPADSESFYWYYSSDGAKTGFFVTALQNGVTTGVLRQHATRMNSSVICESLPRSKYPQGCAGDRPFTSSFVYPGELEIRVCAPGEYGVSPWNESRNRQDISEELYIDVYLPDTSNITSAPSDNSFTIHCKADTTKGYFELGNWRNNYTYGPLVERWPAFEEMSTEWNDYRNGIYDFAVALENDTTKWEGEFPWTIPDVYATEDLSNSGPLMSTMIALFGNGSFFYQAANSTTENSLTTLIQICQQNTVPYSRTSSIFPDVNYYCWMTPEYVNNDKLALMIYAWFFHFNNTALTQELLSAGMFIANQALLSETAAATSPYNSRGIFTSPGITIVRPFTTIAETVIVSVLIFVQLLGLLYTVWYIYRVPTWTTVLDATAIAQIGATLTTSNIPPIGSLSDQGKTRLRSLSGLVGFILDGDLNVSTNECPVKETSPRVLEENMDKVPGENGLQTDGETRLQASSNATSILLVEEPIKLGLDAPGLIRPSMAPFLWLRKRNPKKTLDVPA